MSSKTITTVSKAGAPIVELLAQEEASGAPPITSRLPGQNAFTLSRTDIEFFNIARHLVALQIKVTNDSDAFTAPSTLDILTAPFGAFVPWQPMAAIALPALAPGQARYVRWRAAVVQPEPLGSPDGVGPRDLLTAFGLADEPVRIIRPLLPILRRRIKSAYEARMARARSLLGSAHRCKTRESLESLLGSPAYAMQGQLYSATAVGRPDVVEVYQKDGCTIDLWFKDGKVCFMMGGPSPTMLDYF